MESAFLVSQHELRLRFTHGAGPRALSFGRSRLAPPQWRAACKAKLAELLGSGPVTSGPVRELRTTTLGAVTVSALVMQVEETVSIPAYLLAPARPIRPGRGVMAIHGHGEVGPVVGTGDDYHHAFALELARQGHLVLCPELRGFGSLKNMAAGVEGTRLDYWDWGKAMAYSLVTDGLLHGKTLLGETVEDLLRWEQWLALHRNIEQVDVAGISYGGDLALTYPVFSDRVRRIFASGTLGSFSWVFSRCYNAPAHCIPGVLTWMDRSDIAGLNAPRPIALHYGELDVPGPENYSAAYNESVPSSLEELRAIYGAFGVRGRIALHVSSGKRHEMDVECLQRFLMESPVRD